MIITRLQALETKIKQNDPGFSIKPMWSVNYSRGRMIFHVTAHCVDRVLKSELLSIFSMTDIKTAYVPRFTWKKAPKLSATSILSVVN
ncbi:hypothetical protein GCM10028827_08240 [Mucilaginibacter myungsuensis]